VIKKPRKQEAKAHYRAVENTTTMVCNARKTNDKQQLFEVEIVAIKLILKKRGRGRMRQLTELILGCIHQRALIFATLNFRDLLPVK
jgi:hypothetical protein